MDFALYTTFEGRINRAKYWLGTIVLIVVMLVVALILFTILGVGFSPLDAGFRWGSFILQLIVLYPATALMVKRFQDRNRPGWFAAILLVPLLIQGLLNAVGISNPMNPSLLDNALNLVIFAISIWFFIELGCLRGTVGPNQFGPDPLEGRV
jgi:uncharacterized membrane protein YhaH (DUF805 family)